MKLWLIWQEEISDCFMDDKLSSVSMDDKISLIFFLNEIQCAKYLWAVCNVFLTKLGARLDFVL